jgi:hypothetical protein
MADYSYATMPGLLKFSLIAVSFNVTLTVCSLMKLGLNLFTLNLKNVKTSENRESEE